MSRIKIGSIAKFNQNTLNSSNKFNSILYLDTGNITENIINEMQEFDFKSDKIPSRAKRLVKNNTIIYSTVRPKLHHYGILSNPPENMVVSTGFVTIDVDETKINPYYLYGLLTRAEVTRKLALIADTAVSSYPSINPDDIKDLEIEIIDDRDLQNRIGSLIKLLLEKINNNFNICDELVKISKLIYNYWYLQAEFPNKDGMPYFSNNGETVYNDKLKLNIPVKWKHLKVKDLVENVITGKQDANFATENGKYPFFTCSSEISYCDEAEFKGKAILIAGNGEFNVKYYDGEFNAYQRTYVLIPKDKKYVGLIYEAAIRLIDSFKNASAGSIVKFITKEDIENIDILIPDDENLYLIFNNVLDYINTNQIENFDLIKFKNFLCPLVLNGEVVI